MFTGKTVPLAKPVWLATPTMHGEEITYMMDAYNTNWVSIVGENISVIEKEMAEFLAPKNSLSEPVCATALSCCTASLHFCMKLAGVKPGTKVACSDFTFAATVNPVSYEGGTQVFVDAERDTWNMDPAALEKAFTLYPDIKVVVLVHLYGTPAKMDEILAVCEKHNAVLIEDAAESLGATYKGRQTGTFGRYNAFSFNGNKIITGSTGGMLVSADAEAVRLARKWSTQSREAAHWYQHKELGYNYRISNIDAGIVRGQLPHLQEHIAQKRAIYERYKAGFKGLPVSMNPYDEKNSSPNFWLSGLLIDETAMCRQERSADKAGYIPEHGKSCPTEILEVLAKIRAEGRPIWKPMHLQPVYSGNPFVTLGTGVDNGNNNSTDSGIFARGLCLPSDNKMTEDEQQKIIETIWKCFD